MLINLFVRSTGLVSGLFGAVGHSRVSASAAAQRAAARAGAGHPLRVRGSRVCKVLARVGTGFPPTQRSDPFVFSLGQGTSRSASFLQKLWQWACALLEAPAVSDGAWLWACSAQKAQPVQSLVLTDITDEQSPSSRQCSVPLSSCETHAGSEVWIVEHSQWVWLKELQYPLRFKP